MQKIYNIVVLAICLLVTFAKASQAALTIAEKGKSTFTIVVPEQAPSSVTDAAQELQRCIEIATQTTLPIKRDSENITGPIISLSATRQAAAAQIAVDVESIARCSAVTARMVATRLWTGGWCGDGKAVYKNG